MDSNKKDISQAIKETEKEMINIASPLNDLDISMK